MIFAQSTATELKMKESQDELKRLQDILKTILQISELDATTPAKNYEMWPSCLGALLTVPSKVNLLHLSHFHTRNPPATTDKHLETWKSALVQGYVLCKDCLELVFVPC